MEDYPWKVPLPAGSKVWESVTIKFKNGHEEVILPTEGQHLVIMSWLEIEKTQSQVPGLVLNHTDTEICSRMFDRYFRTYKHIWENLQKMWYMREVQREFVERMKSKFSGRTKAAN